MQITNTTNKTADLVEGALSMYKETVSPSRSSLIKILDQIPEKKKMIKEPEGRAIRSPYIWLAITQAVTVCSLVFALYPSLSEMYIYRDDPFYAIDKQVETFETAINNEDALQMIADSNNTLLLN